jgi:uncharacterized protein with FMN-binding domain
MKKSFCLAVTTSVLLLISGCTARNNIIDNRNNGALNGTNQGNTTGINRTAQGARTGMDNRNYGTGTGTGTTNFGRTSGATGTGILKDGVYTNFGNGHDNVNERATVTINGGRIVNIDLATVSQRDAAYYGARTGYGTGTNNYNANRTTTGIDTGSATGYTGDTNMDNIWGVGTNNTTGTTNDVGLGMGTPGITGTGIGAGTGIGTGTGTGIRTGTGTQMGTTGTTAQDPSRTNLINAMISAQSDNVTLNDQAASSSVTVQNWKLALSRALYQARR